MGFDANSDRNECNSYFSEPHKRSTKVVIVFFSYNPHLPPSLPPGRPTPQSLISVHFGSISVRFGSFRVRLGPFRVCFWSVWGPFRGVGWGRGGGRGWGRGGVGGGVGERGFCKGKEYHYTKTHCGFGILVWGKHDQT